MLGSQLAFRLSCTPLVAVALAAALWLSGCSSNNRHNSSSGTGHTRSSSEGRKPKTVQPPLLVAWHQVGDISLGEPRERVEREYGSTGSGLHVIQRYSGAVQGWYKGLGGSQVIVTFYGRRVGEIDLGSRSYRTKRGFGVGSRIPLGPCHERTIALSACEHRWHGFVWNAWAKATVCGCWTKVGMGRKSLPARVESFEKPWFIIYVRHGRVAEFDFDLKYID